MKDFVTIARIVKTRGVRGELVAEIWTDFPDRFQEVEETRVWTPRGVYQEELESHWFHKGRIVLKFAGRDTPEEASHLVGGEVQVPLQDRVPLEEGSYYQDDLIGCSVLGEQGALGQVVDVFDGSGDVSNLVIRNPEGMDWMLPLAAEFVVRVDVEKKEIKARPSPGLLELALPGEPERGKRKQRTRKRRDARISRSSAPPESGAA